MDIPRPTTLVVATYKCNCRSSAVIRDYEDWLAEQLLDPSSPASSEIHRLAALARKQDICPVCFCAPKACRADIIKRTIEAINHE